MPLRLDVKRKLLARSDRVKSVDLHGTEPWMLSSLYNGKVHVWNYENQQMVKSFEVCDLPVRTARFITRKNWIITGSDDMQIRVFNYNTLDRVHQFEGHSDYVRCIAIHPTLPYVLTASDDMSIKLWDWDNKWQLKQTFEGHSHYVMQVVVNPKDNNTFATASLDRTVKVWQLGSNQPNFTLEGHEKGVNCVDYYHGGDKPYLISGADDRLVKIWDYQNKTCVATLEGHAQNISAVCFHPELPIILTGSEDSTVRIWHANTYRLETTLNYGLERVWVISALKGGNTVAIGYDEGSIIIKLGREEPAVSMDSSGKILFAKHSEIQQANLKALTSSSGGGEASNVDVKDGERLPLSVTEAGACEIYPQTIQHSPNGRFAVVCGDGEYIIYTAMKLRNKSFGSAQEFVWSNDSNIFAVRESASSIKIFKNFKEFKQIKPDYSVEGICGGSMLGVRSSNHLCFYDWEKLRLIRRIEITAKLTFWSENGALLCVTTEDSFYILKYNAELVASTPDDSASYSDDGIEDAFEVLGEVSDVVKTGLWVGDCFAYTTAHSRLNYYVGGEIVTVAHLDRPMYLLGYISKDSRLYLSDKDLTIVSYQLLASVLEYQTSVMRRDFDTADKVLPTIPKDQRTRVAHFLEKQGFKKQALAVSQDSDHRFDLALNLGELKVAHEIALEADSEEKWRQLSQAATMKSNLTLAGECLSRAKDYGGLLLLASSAGSFPLMNQLSQEAVKSEQNNVAFVSSFLLGKIDDCLDLLIKTDRLPEAALFARTYAPSQISRIVSLWKDKVSNVSSKMADRLADPTKYENLFPGLKEAYKAEQYLRHVNQQIIPAAAYTKVPPNCERNVIEEAADAEARGVVRFDIEGNLVGGGATIAAHQSTRRSDPIGAVVEPSPPFSFKNRTPVDSDRTAGLNERSFNVDHHSPSFGGRPPAASGRRSPLPAVVDFAAKKSHRSPPPSRRSTASGGAAMTPPPDEPDPFADDLFNEPTAPAPDIARSSQLQPDLVMPSMATNNQPPQVVRDTQRKLRDSDSTGDPNLDLDLDNLDLNDVDIEGDAPFDEELNLTDD